MRSNTQLGKVVSSHSSACGASSFSAKLRIDSRSASCSSLKMKWRFLDPNSGFRFFSPVAMGRGSPRSTDGSRDGSRPWAESKQWYCLLSARCLRWGELRRRGIAAVAPGLEAAGGEHEAVAGVVGRGVHDATAPGAACRDGHAMLVEAPAANRVRRLRAVRLSPPAADRPYAQHVLSGRGIPVEAPLAPHRRGDLVAQLGGTPGAVVYLHLHALDSFRRAPR